MSVARGISLAVLAAALAFGAWADRLPDRVPVMQEGRRVIAADFHVHTALGDGGIPPWNIGREARRRGLDAVALTNHNQVFAARLARWLSRHLGGTIVLAGQEVTNPGFHVVAAGLYRAVDWRMPVAEMIADIHAQGGVAIAAHPERPYWPAFDAPAMRALDGTEVLHPLIFTNSDGRRDLAAFRERVQGSRDRPLAAIGSSDFHTLATLGRCRTFVFARDLSEPAILEAVRKGRTQPHAQGDPLPAHTPPPPPDPALGPSGILGLLALLGLLTIRR
jgi:predicted metal-dependent phosphoesterase TrpH